MALDTATCDSYKAIKANILAALESGLWKNVKIEVDGDSVQTTSISQLTDYLKDLEALIDACDAGPALAGSQLGMRTTAYNAGDGLC